MASGSDELLPALRVGDEDAFKKLAQTELMGLHVIALGILGSAEEAEDACQEVLLRLYRSAPKFPPDTNLRAWLRRVCVNYCLDQKRRRRGRNFAGPPSESQLKALPNAAPERVVEDAAFRRAVMAALLQVPPRQRAVFVLRHFVGCSVRETAAALGCAEGTVKAQLSRAVQKLRELLSDWAPQWMEVSDNE